MKAPCYRSWLVRLLQGASVLSAGGCAGSDHAQPPPADFISEARRTASGQATFAFGYAAPPPEGRILHVAVATAEKATCDLLTSGAGDLDFTALNVVISNADHGIYSIEPDPVFPGQSVGYVEWVRVERGHQVEAVRASGGTVEYRGGPQDEATWSEEGTARLVVDADFAVDPVVKSECDGGMAPDGAAEGACSCWRRSSSVFTCTPSAPFKNCCNDSEAGNVELVHFEINATRCHAGCGGTTAELRLYCDQLVP